MNKAAQQTVLLHDTLNQALGPSGLHFMIRRAAVMAYSRYMAVVVSSQRLSSLCWDQLSDLPLDIGACYETISHRQHA